MSSRFSYFVAVSPGLEGLLRQELERLGLSARECPGGAEFRGTMDQLWSLHRYSRLAESARLRLKPFHARSFSELESQLAKLPWHAYIRRGSEVRVDVTCRKSRLYHSDAVAERLRRVLTTRLGQGADEALGEQRVFVRVVRDRVQVSVDASGELLHRRGYRTHVTRAPLRETLAAAMLDLMVEHSEDNCAPIWDPFCGSGTLPIEWVLRLLGHPARVERRFAFENWPVHDPAEYENWLHARAPSEGMREHSSQQGRILAYGSDANSSAVAAARHNAQRAGVQQQITLWQSDFRAAIDQVPKATRIATNPPFGVRVQRGSAQQLVAEFEHLLAERRDLRPVLMLLSEQVSPGGTGLEWRQAARFASGGLPVRAWFLSR